LEYCAKGDEVHVVGLSAESQPDVVQARSLTVTAAKPLAFGAGNSLKKPGPKSNSGKVDEKADNKNEKNSPKATGKK
jgi:hypothetical protein